jgi:hypothetical protein
MGSPSATSMGFPSPPSSPTGGAAALGPSNLFTSSKNYYMTVPDEPCGDATATAPQPLSPIGKIIPQHDDMDDSEVSSIQQQRTGFVLSTGSASPPAASTENGAPKARRHSATSGTSGTSERDEAGPDESSSDGRDSVPLQDLYPQSAGDGVEAAGQRHRGSTSTEVDSQSAPTQATQVTQATQGSATDSPQIFAKATESVSSLSAPTQPAMQSMPASSSVLENVQNQQDPGLVFEMVSEWDQLCTKGVETE